jgi:hypothetical protein
MAGMITMKKNLNSSWTRMTKKARRLSLNRTKSHLPSIRAKSLHKMKAPRKKENKDEEDDDDYIDEEEMLDIAERCFVKIAEAILEAGLTVRQAFNPYIIREDFEGEALELLSPIGFLEGVKELGVVDLEEVEVACLMRVLTKADLENANPPKGTYCDNGELWYPR